MAGNKNDSPWPLFASIIIDDEQMAKFDTEDWPERVLDSMFQEVRTIALRHLREAGRVRDVRMLQLYCYNYDTTKTPTGEE
jgi:hypothetical protein